ncbi:hypothetical protein [Gemmatimonas aurantiaca]|uniref:hypothetical protein n=1 Tax=Gemmatimonas aurantiaca TaxID=173480 RepID=UPI00301CC0ED
MRFIAPAARWTIVVVLCGAIAACAHSAFERQLRAGRWEEAATIFRNDSLLLRDVGAIRRVARIHAMPDSSTWDPQRALELLRASRTYFQTRTVPEGDVRLERLLQLIVSERRTHEAEHLRLRDSLDDQRMEMERLQRDSEQLRTVSATNEAERVLLQRLVTRLESDLRDRENQLGTLRSELERLKAIDLSRPARPPE